MKRSILGTALTLLTLVSMTACGDKEASKPLGEITAAVKDSGIKFPDMEEVEKGNFDGMYDIDPDEYEDFSVYIAGSGGEADEICLIKAKDGKTEDVKKKVENRKKSQEDSFKDYVPAEYDELCNSEVKTEGNYVYWLCTEDNGKAEDKLLSYFE